MSGLEFLASIGVTSAAKASGAVIAVPSAMESAAGLLQAPIESASAHLSRGVAKASHAGSRTKLAAWAAGALASGAAPVMTHRPLYAGVPAPRAVEHLHANQGSRDPDSDNLDPARNAYDRDPYLSLDANCEIKYFRSQGADPDLKVELLNDVLPKGPRCVRPFASFTVHDGQKVFFGDLTFESADHVLKKRRFAGWGSTERMFPRISISDKALPQLSASSVQFIVRLKIPVEAAPFLLNAFGPGVHHQLVACGLRDDNIIVFLEFMDDSQVHATVNRDKLGFNWKSLNVPHITEVFQHHGFTMVQDDCGILPEATSPGMTETRLAEVFMYAFRYAATYPYDLKSENCKAFADTVYTSTISRSWRHRSDTTEALKKELVISDAKIDEYKKRASKMAEQRAANRTDLAVGLHTGKVLPALPTVACEIDEETIAAGPESDTFVIETRLRLAWCYHVGVGVKANPQFAWDHYQKVINSSLPVRAIALNNTGGLLESGQMGVINRAKALEKYREAWDEGLLLGMFNTTRLQLELAEAKDFEPHQHLEDQLYRCASEGLQPAFEALLNYHHRRQAVHPIHAYYRGIVLASGCGIPRFCDPAASVRSYADGARLGNPECLLELKQAASKNVGDAFALWVAHFSAQVQANAGQDQAVGAMMVLGDAYETGLGVPGNQNADVASEWLHRSLSAGHPAAHSRLSTLAKSVPKAFQLLVKWTQAHCKWYDAGVLWKSGMGNELFADKRQAVVAFTSGAEKDQQPCVEQLRELARDRVVGAFMAYRAYLQRHAALGEPEAIISLAAALESGLGDGQYINLNGAAEWYGKALQLNVGRASADLARVASMGSRTAFDLLVQWYSDRCVSDPALWLELGALHASGQNRAEFRSSVRAVECYMMGARANVRACLQALRQAASVNADTAFATLCQFYQEKWEHGDKEAILSLAELYSSGCGVETNCSKQLAADTYFKAHRADIPNSLAELRALAAQGVGQARFHLGFCYAEGIGVEPSVSVAITHYRDAARVNHVAAFEQFCHLQRSRTEQTGDANDQYALGDALRTGLGMPACINKEAAVSFIASAAGQGHPDALPQLRSMASQGWPSAFETFVRTCELLLTKTASEPLQANLMAELGQAFASGFGAKEHQNADRAVYWFGKALSVRIEHVPVDAIRGIREAAAQGWPGAFPLLVSHFKLVTESNKRERGSAAMQLFEFYQSGLGQAQNVDKEQAAAFVHMAAEEGTANAAAQLRACCVEKKWPAAFRFYCRFMSETLEPKATSTHVQEIYELATLYRTGAGLQQQADLGNAVRWLNRLVAEHHLPSMVDLAEIRIAAGEYASAAQLLQRSQALPRGKTHLALLYMEGLGVQKQEKHGLALLREAARANDPNAIRHLSNTDASECLGFLCCFTPPRWR